MGLKSFQSLLPLALLPVLFALGAHYVRQGELALPQRLVQPAEELWQQLRAQWPAGQQQQRAAAGGGSLTGEVSVSGVLRRRSISARACGVHRQQRRAGAACGARPGMPDMAGVRRLCASVR
jgi:hypothetical protein